jgi:ribosomal protein S18 acetylase RimI-like enzyme
MNNANDVEIVRLLTVDDEFVGALHRMIPQLAPGAPLPTREHLDEVVRCATNTVLAARIGDSTVGTLTLTMVHTPTVLMGWIADVVVDNEIRGRGIGEMLVRRALAVAAEKGAKYVDLSSRPAREAANRLYQRIGFNKRETNYYRYLLKPE